MTTPLQPTAPPPALSPYLTDRHEQLWREVDAFAAEDVVPRVKRMEAAPGRVEHKIAQLMSQRGWFAVTIPRRHGGPSGRTRRQNGLGPPDLPDIGGGRGHPASHIGGIETTAKRSGGDWVITGSKAHVGNSHLAGAHIVLARTAEPGVPTSAALTALLVESGRKGVTVRRHMPGLGLHGFSPAGALSRAAGRGPGPGGHHARRHPALPHQPRRAADPPARIQRIPPAGPAHRLRATARHTAWRSWSGGAVSSDQQLPASGS
ncbi:acyl-CoA dehydrogenase family protein [Streptomyces sp. NPDC046805]|uniref:acyl-CoA dehydrogenase family protein n=1 Tax=Streptomyces sp. NPDC046805 TaxID=3155134 RepID=UPI0033CAD612